MTSRTEKNKEQADEIINEEKRVKSKKRNTKITIVTVILITILTLTYSYMRFIATSGIIVKEYSLSYDNLPIEFDGIKVIQLSKINYGSTINKQELNDITKKINYIKPDIIIFTGDLLSEDYKSSKQENETLIKSLNNLEATIGKYAVLSNNDKSVANNIMNNTDFQILEDSYELIYHKGVKPIILMGIKSKNNIDVSSSYYKEETSNKNIFNITITSDKKLINQIMQNDYRQNIIMTNDNESPIKIPFVTDYKETYTINNTNIFVSSGLGTSINKLRLFNRPSINFYRINVNDN